MLGVFERGGGEKNRYSVGKWEFLLCKIVSNAPVNFATIRINTIVMVAND